MAMLIGEIASFASLVLYMMCCRVFLSLSFYRVLYRRFTFCLVYVTYVFTVYAISLFFYLLYKLYTLYGQRNAHSHLCILLCTFSLGLFCMVCARLFNSKSK